MCLLFNCKLCTEIYVVQIKTLFSPLLKFPYVLNKLETPCLNKISTFLSEKVSLHLIKNIK